MTQRQEHARRLIAGIILILSLAVLTSTLVHSTPGMQLGGYLRQFLRMPRTGGWTIYPFNWLLLFYGARILLVLLFAATLVLPLLMAWRGSFSGTMVLTVNMSFAWMAIRKLWSLWLMAPPEPPANPATPSTSTFSWVQMAWDQLEPLLMGIFAPLQLFLLPLLVATAWLMYLTKEVRR